MITRDFDSEKMAAIQFMVNNDINWPTIQEVLDKKAVAPTGWIWKSMSGIEFAFLRSVDGKNTMVPSFYEIKKDLVTKQVKVESEVKVTEEKRSSSFIGKIRDFIFVA